MQSYELSIERILAYSKPELQLSLHHAPGVPFETHQRLASPTFTLFLAADCVMRLSSIICLGCTRSSHCRCCLCNWSAYRIYLQSGDERTVGATVRVGVVVATVARLDLSNQSG